MPAANPPTIKFPCAYPIKVVGVAGVELRALVVAVMARHAPEFDAAAMRERPSRHGNYTAYTVTITAQGKPQLQAIFADLKTSALVKLVL